MTSLQVESLRGSHVESRHRVSAAVVNGGGKLVAGSGDPDLRAFMRSAAKPFQALPLVADGAADRFSVTPQELALACASHNSEPGQVALVRSWLARIGCVEADLACGPHPPVSQQLSVEADVEAVFPATPVSNNCSGKHTGMLTLARYHDWPTRDYHLPNHPVQQRCRESVARLTGVAPRDLIEAVDGCRVVCFALPLRAMALGFARLGTSRSDAERRVVQAMTAHPDMVGGRGRLCTALMAAYPGRVVAKVGAEGVYGVALPELELGVALKVEDGNAMAAVVAVLAILAQLGLTPVPADVLPGYAEIPVRSSRGESVGAIRATGELTFV